MIGSRRDQQDRCRARRQQGAEAGVALKGRELREARGQWRGQQEGEEHLDPGLDDAYFLQELDKVAIAALERRFIAAGRAEIGGRDRPRSR